MLTYIQYICVYILPWLRMRSITNRMASSAMMMTAAERVKLQLVGSVESEQPCNDYIYQAITIHLIAHFVQRVQLHNKRKHKNS